MAYLHTAKYAQVLQLVILIIYSLKNGSGGGSETG